MKNKLKAVTENLMFTLSEQEMAELVSDFDDLLVYFEYVKAIDTHDTEPLAYPFEAETYFLRDDKVSEVHTVKEVLGNCAQVQRNMVLVPKVVK